MESVFNKFEDEEIDEPQRKRKLVPLDYGDTDKSLGLDGAELAGSKNNINTEEKRKHIKSLIEKIPTARPELFSYPLDWTMVDSVRTASQLLLYKPAFSKYIQPCLICVCLDPDGSTHTAVDQQENYRIHRRGGGHTG